MKRRGKMLSRAIFWTVGVLLGFAINSLRHGSPDAVEFYIAIWSGMMMAALFVYLDPPQVATDGAAS